MLNLYHSLFSEIGLRNELHNIVTFKEFKSGQIIVEAGKYIRAVPLVLEGSIKVVRVDNSGNRLFLYHIESGHSCAFSLSACIMDKVSSIEAIVEVDTAIMIIPADYARKWFEQYASWRTFVINTFNERFNEMVDALDMVAFRHIDQRLEQYLLNKVQVTTSNALYITHQTIATELSTSREVISRLLKKLEKEQKITLHRNYIEIISLV